MVKKTSKVNLVTSLIVHMEDVRQALRDGRIVEAYELCGIYINKMHCYLKLQRGA